MRKLFCIRQNKGADPFGVRLVSDVVGNTEDSFSHEEAQLGLSSK